MSTASLILSLFFLFGGAILAGFTASIQQIGKRKLKEELRHGQTPFFFQHILKTFLGKWTWDALFLSLSFSKHFFHLCYGITALFFLLLKPSFSQLIHSFDQGIFPVSNGLWITAFLIVIPLPSLLLDLILKSFSVKKKLLSFRIFSRLASFYLTFTLPITIPIVKIVSSLALRKEGNSSTENSVYDLILEMIHESDVSSALDPQEKNLIVSVANFTKRCVREVMVPRINIMALSLETSLEETAKLFLLERYSRIPVYQDTIDHIVGVLLYKDVLSAYTEEDPHSSIKSLMKPVLYTPEMKKISILLQEFRSKQLHLAIVVDEYGGTEGIVTIEDILEELVGEIADEDDASQELLFSHIPSGGWIVDARMTILDIEKELFIHIPPSPEYDTLGGYIYHQAKSIPSKGWRLHHDNFDLEILSSDERSLEKIKILPSPIVD
ncbi:hemolysin family protein [Rhabdochlamydiaceae symbiont of Dictyostelium giganteum]|uniref:hemolysin family protein n=1 Tax=Rhabdochlamydiaceae symbiont of Dictyostelium giganteum TaxID=3342349 RepID=UPI00384B367B